MDEKQKVPVVRFKGFTGDWERRKLGEVFKEYSEKNHPELPPLTIVQGRGTVLREDSERALQYDKSSLPSYKLVNKDDFIVHLRSFEGGLEKATTQGIISPAYHTFHGEGTDSRFYYAYFRSQKFINHDLFPYVYGIRDGRSIDIDGMKKIRLPFPSYAEQKKIGDFIDTIDGYSTLHQQKLDQLKKLKAYFLQNLFPAKGEKVPKIRFKGFTGDWEERKIGDCFDERKEGMPHGELLSVTINEGVKRFSELERHDSSNQDKSKYKKVCIGDIAYNSMRMWQGASGVSTYEGIVSPAYTILKPKNGINSKFVSYLFKKKDILYIFQVNSQGITSDNWNLKFPILSKISIRVPASIKEQNKIAKQMEKIDDIITLHQQKIAQFQAVKKFLLQNLFV